MEDQCGSGTADMSNEGFATTEGGETRVVSKLRPCFAYLSDWEAVGGSAGLFEDKRAIDSFALRNRFAVTRYFVDSGRANGLPAVGAGLDAMVNAMGSQNRGRSVIVAGLGSLAPAPDRMSEVIAYLDLHGVRVIDASVCDKTRTGSRYRVYERRSRQGRLRLVGDACSVGSRDNCP